MCLSHLTHACNHYRPKLSKSLKVDASKIALRSADDLKRLEIDITLATVRTD